MAYIYIGQYHGTSFISRLIKWRTWSNISHTSAFYPVTDNPREKSVIEAWKGSVKKEQWNKNHKKGTRIDIYRVECSPKQAELFYILLENKIGSKYDYKAILGFITRSHIQDENKWFCSELIFEIAKKVGIILLKHIDSWKVSPGLLNLSPKLEYIETRTIP